MSLTFWYKLITFYSSAQFCVPPRPFFLVSNGCPAWVYLGLITVSPPNVCWWHHYLLYSHGRGAEDVATKWITVMEKAAVWVNYLWFDLTCCHVFLRQNEKKKMQADVFTRSNQLFTSFLHQNNKKIASFPSRQHFLLIFHSTWLKTKQICTDHVQLYCVVTHRFCTWEENNNFSISENRIIPEFKVLP